MFPLARKRPLDFDRIGGQLLARKKDLKQHGVPEMEEDEMIDRVGTRNDSPARLARANPGSRPAAKAKAGQEKKVIKLPTRAGKAKAAKPAKKAKAVKSPKSKPVKAKSLKAVKASGKGKPAARKAALGKAQARHAQRGARR